MPPQSAQYHATEDGLLAFVNMDLRINCGREAMMSCATAGEALTLLKFAPNMV
jgi:hypothetical protein